MYLLLTEQKTLVPLDPSSHPAQNCLIQLTASVWPGVFMRVPVEDVMENERLWNKASGELLEAQMRKHPCKVH